MKNKTPIRVGGYVRVSTENQIENYSIDEQVERLKAYCKAKDWAVYKFYTDAGYSGGNTHRPALEQMLEDVRAHLIDVVVVYKLDRLSRSQKDTLTLIEDKFLANGVDFVSMSENFDTSTPFGRAMIGILSVFAQLEKDQITERFTMGRIGRSKAGYYHGGAVSPTGYNYIDGNLVADEYKAPQVREVFERFLSGSSINSIQKFMHEKYGGWNSHTSVIQILRNSVYIGKVKFKKTEYDGLHTPIVPTDIFNRAQELLTSTERESNKTTWQKTPFRAGYLLSSLVFCSRCGAKYAAAAGYYKCYSRSKCGKQFIKDPNCKNQNWKIELLDELVLSEIKKFLYGERDIGEIFEESVKASPVTDKKAVSARIKEINAQTSRLIELYQVGGIEIQQLSKKIDELKREKDCLQDSLSVKEIDLEESKQRFYKLLSGLEDVFSGDSIDEKRLFVSSAIESIWIDGDNVNIKWRV